ncbi:GET complex, subunit GET2 [Hyphopichia burtonii NRRL Y-1933]|uniref:Golgi to ER traffic protein 2 n=1 Tax=Hyphopichia burtonii NRRL Y-1933 TaxID=984485 RepID=A0A1E4RIJ3_9ASCO|nr:GET complex, subunit GET2 [Hyphopichia burtonii NRRL Y-1933]ODV66915.1 GET complex, subunit GET2 [Hyphopichia burtonii NRRL Y-1933]
MSEQPLSADEKRRLLRERRQAKMQQGKASERLNNILSQGSSVKSDQPSISVLDKPQSTPSPSLTPQMSNASLSAVNKDSDPEVLDLDTIIKERDGTPQNKAQQDPDFDEMLNKIFGAGAPGAPGNQGGAGNGQEDPISQMMMSLLNQDGGDGMPNFGNEANNGPQNVYQQQLNEYNVYNQKSWKFRFLIVRYTAILINFFYHYLTIADLSFQSSSYSYVRGLVATSPTNTFITTFLSIELVILTTYFIIGTQKHLFKTASENNPITKLLSMGSLVLPQLQQYRSLIVSILGYWDLLGMLLSDISLVIVLFGLISRN